MPLAMPRPMKRSDASTHQFVQRIPADIKHKVRGSTVAVRVGEETVMVHVSEKAQDIRVSLRTRDPHEARERQAMAVASLEKAWRAVREGPRALTHREIVALSGLLYQDLTALAHEEPGPADLWHHVANLKRRALEDGKLEEWLGGTVDGLLLRQGLYVDPGSRSRLLEASAKALIDAAAHLARNAGGDYRSDPVADRFPEWKGAAPTPQAKPSKASAISAIDLLMKLAAERAYAPKTVSEWTRSVSSLTDHAGTTEAAAITPEHIITWTDALVARGLSAKTINETYIAAVKALFRWAKAKRLVVNNPALEVPKVERRDEDEGKRGFTLAEANAILQAAMRETSAVRRWVPWLLAHTGARAGEIMQLRKQDVLQEPESGLWYIDISPRAGRLKNKPSARVVPLHPQLVALGFPAWALGQKADRLFYEERPGEAEDGRRSTKSIAINRLGDWVREIGLPGVLSGEVSPNHGWRHRMVTELTNYEVTETVRKRITGHQLAGQDNRYVGKIILERLHSALSRLSPYEAAGDAAVQPPLTKPRRT